MNDLDFIKKQPVGVRHLRDGLAIPAPSAESKRVLRHLLHTGCQSLVYPFWSEKIDKTSGEIKKRSEFRVSVCGRESVGEEVRIYKNDTAVGVSGVLRCGNVWGCIFCSTKILRSRAEQIGQLFNCVHANNGSAVLVTLTASHHLEDKLSDLLIKLKSALIHMSRSRLYRDLVTGRSGLVVSTEINWGSRGWHPHSHQAWFFPFSPCPDCEILASKLFKVWELSCKRHELFTLEFYRGHRVGVDCTPSWDAADYLSKFDREREWGLSAEMTQGRQKMARNENLTPWSLLEGAVIRGKNSEEAKLWIEYLRATKGFQCVSLRGARDLLIKHGLPTNYDDWKTANEPGEGEIIGTLSAQSYDGIIRNGGLGKLLEAARKDGFVGIAREIESF